MARVTPLKAVSAELEGNGKRDETIPDGWALDSEGLPTTDGRAAIDGVVLPAAGPKGSGIAIVVDILSGVLSGAGFGPYINPLYLDFKNPQDVGHVFQAIDISKFMPIDVFESRMDAMIEELKNGDLAPGFDEILMPGEPELRHQARLLETGIALPDNVVEEVRSVADELGIPFPNLVPA